MGYYHIQPLLIIIDHLIRFNNKNFSFKNRYFLRQLKRNCTWLWSMYKSFYSWINCYCWLRLITTDHSWPPSNFSLFTLSWILFKFLLNALRKDTIIIIPWTNICHWFEVKISISKNSTSNLWQMVVQMAIMMIPLRKVFINFFNNIYGDRNE